MKTLNVGLKENSYDIHIENGLIESAGKYIKQFLLEGDRIAVVSDENVWSLHGDKLISSLQNSNVEADVHIIKAGEESKNIEVLSSIYDWLGEECKMNRNGLLIAFGGGVVGDITGFAAATWMRGIRYIQIPTTLLAQVDSSVGGKTAIDTRKGKNLVGAFYQPQMVLIDPEILETLPARDFNSGMAEVIKYGVIASPSLMEKLKNAVDIMDGIDEIIYECCDIKRKVVEDDEFDTGQRMILNFGHTFGHAIEVKHGFEKYTHGEGVAQGMVLASKVGEKLGIATHDTTEEIATLIMKYGHVMPEDAVNLLEYMKLDKKASVNKITLILPSEIGKVRIESYDYAEIEKVLSEIEIN